MIKKKEISVRWKTHIVTSLPNLQLAKRSGWGVVLYFYKYNVRCGRALAMESSRVAIRYNKLVEKKKKRKH